MLFFAFSGPAIFAPSNINPANMSKQESIRKRIFSKQTLITLAEGASLLLLGFGPTLFGSCSRKPAAVPPSAIVAENGDTLSGTIQLSGAFALYAMAVRWSSEFRQLHPHVRIDISGGGAGKGMTDALAGVVDLGMVSRDIYQEELDKGAFPIAVTKDAVVPTINIANPEYATLQEKGLSKDLAARLWTSAYKTWGEAWGNESRTPIHVFTRSDACGAGETFANWFGLRQEQLRATAINGDPGIAAAIQKDRLAIGYNNIAYIYDPRTRKPYEGLSALPIDANGNGVIDPEEQFYDTVDSLVAAIQDGRYPSPPARDLYLVARGKPSSPLVLEFLRFILTEGQQFAGETGYVAFSEETLQHELRKLE